jgi:hypothetical protein
MHTPAYPSEFPVILGWPGIPSLNISHLDNSRISEQFNEAPQLRVFPLVCPQVYPQILGISR